MPAYAANDTEIPNDSSTPWKLCTAFWCGPGAAVNARGRVSRFKEIAPPLSLCIFISAHGHPARDQRDKGSVLRSSADETGYLSSARNEIGHIICSCWNQRAAPVISQNAKAVRSRDEQVRRDKFDCGKLKSDFSIRTRRNTALRCREYWAKARRRQGVCMTTTVGYVSMRRGDAGKTAALTTGSCSAIVRHTRHSASPISFVALSRSAARALQATASRGQILAPPFLT